MDDDEDVLVLKNKKQRVDEEGIDRISGLSDEIIHLILSHLDAKLAVQLCIISKRWRYVWKTLPFLDFSNYKPQYLSNVTLTQFVESFLGHRNHQHEISQMKLSFSITPPTYEFITYAIQHNVQNLDLEISHVIHAPKLSTFSSNSLKELKLILRYFEFLESDCWDLPALRYLHFTSRGGGGNLFHKLAESYLCCLSSLETLVLDGFELPNSITFPGLKNLYLKYCKLSQKFWDLPALFNLTLENVEFPKDLRDFFPALVNLRNLTLFFQIDIEEDILIKCPQLVNLEIKTSMTMTISRSARIIVLAPKICNFSSDGFFPITVGNSELENVNIKLQENISYINCAPSNKLKNYYRRAEQMFAGLGRARILTLDLQTIKALNSVSDVLVGSPSPFYNLKCVKIPPESCISAGLKRYLLGCCPEATIVTTVPKIDLFVRLKGASLTAQHVAPCESLAAPTKILVDSENIPNLDMGFKEKHMVQNSVIHAEGTGNDGAISSRGNCDSGLWQGYEVNSEFVCLLNLIINKYPETFEHFNAKSKRVCTMKLNMLCTSICDFAKISVTEVNTEMIAEYRNVFAALQDLGFNLNWLVCRLNYLEQLWFSKPLNPQLHAIDCQIDETKTKLRDLQTLLAEKMQEIEKAFGVIGTKLAVGNIKDEEEEEGIDRISSLSDELIHLILSYLDAQLAVQLSILSKRWRYVWKTLPFLDFTFYKQQCFSNVTLTQFVESFLCHRNHQQEISQMKLCLLRTKRPTTPPTLVYDFITYAIQHNVQNLDVDVFSHVVHVPKLSTFSSNSLKELKLILRYIKFLESDCWDLPALRYLHFTWRGARCKLPESYLGCLSSLETLFLDGFELPNSITFPGLKNLHLKYCKFSKKFWDLPALLNLTLHNIQFPKDSSDFFPVLVNLRNLTLFFQRDIEEDILIKCPQLVNLEIKTIFTITISPSVKIIVLATKIRNFSSDGFFPVTFGDSELENVSINLRDNTIYNYCAPSNKLRNYYRQVEQMFAGLGSARILTLDSETIKALTAVSDVLVASPSPFYNLKYVKVPPYKESCVSACLKRYLLGCCPGAMIVTTLPQHDLNPCSKWAAVRAPTKVVVDYENIPESVSVNTVVKAKHMVQNSVIHAKGTGSDQVISSRGNCDFGLWRGHEVNSEFLCLLDLIINKYPETFEHFNAKSKRVSATKLNMLCTSINDFTKISLTEVNTEIIAEYRNIFAALQDLGFNLNWLVCRLNYLEQLWFMQAMNPQLHAIKGQIDETKNKSRDPQTIRPQQMKKIEIDFIAIGTNLAVGNIGDHLFSGP